MGARTALFGQAAAADRPAAPTIVLVHGISDDGTGLRPLQNALEAAGYRCFTPPLKPSDGRLGLTDLARKLKAAVDRRLGPDAPIFVVGYSMGGLIARCYLEELGGVPRCQGLLTVSTPHAGSIMAYLIEGQGARDLRPGSPFLERLRQNEFALADVPLASCWSPLDIVIFPAFSSLWHRAENRIVFCSCHPAMVRSHLVIRFVLRQLARSRPRAGLSAVRLAAITRRSPARGSRPPVF